MEILWLCVAMYTLLLDTDILAEFTSKTLSHNTIIIIKVLCFYFRRKGQTTTAQILRKFDLFFLLDVFPSIDTYFSKRKQTLGNIQSIFLEVFFSDILLHMRVCFSEWIYGHKIVYWMRFNHILLGALYFRLLVGRSDQSITLVLINKVN